MSGADPFFGPDGATLAGPLGTPGGPLGVGNALPGVGEVCSLLCYQINVYYSRGRFELIYFLTMG